MAGHLPRILLIEPPFLRLFKDAYSLERYPLSLGYLAGAILANGQWDVKTYNADFRPQGETPRVRYLAGEGYENFRRNLSEPTAPVWREVRKVLEEVRPDAVGISVKTQTLASARQAARLAKQQNPGVPVIVGGPHPSIAPERALACGDFDMAVLGEGEETIVELLETIRRGKDPAGVAGIAYRRGDTVVRTAPRRLIENLDALPFPHASAQETLIGYSRYPAGAFRYVFAVRGCPYPCVFCGSRHVWTRRVRYRSPENVAAELRALRERGLNFVHFDDDTFGVSPSYIRRLCGEIEARCPGLRWSCELHVKLARDDLLAAMRRAGCRMVQLGVESGSDEILHAMRKGFTVAEALAACRRITAAGLRLHTFFLVGFPGETEQTLEQTERTMRQIAAHRVVYSIFAPYPGTEIHEQCRRNGQIDEQHEESLYYHQNPDHCFSPHITPREFRRRLEKIERAVDRRNAWGRIRELASPDAWRRIGESGLRESIGKAWRILRGR